MVKTLVDLCTAVCIRNLREINDVGGAPYSVLRPVLLKVDNPTQLRELEERSPHLLGETAECWQRLINRHFPHQVKKNRFEPRNPALWSKVYDKYKKVDAEEKKAALELLTGRFKDINKEKATMSTSLIDYNAKILGPAPGRRRGAARPASTGGALTWGGGSRTKTNSAQSIMRRARREAAEVSRRNKLSTPTGQLAVRQGQITRAPMGMVEEHRIKSLPNVKRIQPPQKRTAQRWGRDQEQREDRLLKLKRGAIPSGATVVSDDELLAEDDEADYFDSDEEGGGLDPEDIEEDYYDDQKSIPSRGHSSHTPTSNLSGLAKMKMGHGWKNKPMMVVPVETSKSQPASRPKTPSSAAAPKASALSPPPRYSNAQEPSYHAHSASPGAADSGNSSADPKPKLKQMKRKAPPSVFMKPKPKARRMS
ncbi:RNA polymerase II transcription factor SIII subunit A-domain-containing protein [Hypoxylon crocopeplum]|nr:RNA polymerase II transcription factor SIII subunit A-domain-containing protein [Hypoxylon crocopeplum]